MYIHYICVVDRFDVVFDFTSRRCFCDTKTYYLSTNMVIKLEVFIIYLFCHNLLMSEASLVIIITILDFSPEVIITYLINKNYLKSDS